MKGSRGVEFRLGLGLRGAIGGAKCGENAEESGNEKEGDQVSASIVSTAIAIAICKWQRQRQHDVLVHTRDATQRMTHLIVYVYVYVRIKNEG